MHEATDIESRSIHDAWRQVCASLDVDKAEARVAVRAWVDELDREQPTPTGYSRLPAAFVSRLQAAVGAAKHPQALRWLDLILLELASQFEARFEQAALPDELRPEFHENFERMVARASATQGWARGTDDDIFLKDLGIARMTLLPCASHLIFRHSGVPRRLVVRQRPADVVRALGFLGLHCRGFAPFLENHVHIAMLRHFNAEGRERCYRLVAKLLERWPDSRGLMGLSWYYDPAVARISPRLAYLREVPLQGGALFLPAGCGRDAAAGAIATSRTRRRLYEAGEYRPTWYLMVWARQDLLRHSRCGPASPAPGR